MLYSYRYFTLLSSLWLVIKLSCPVYRVYRNGHKMKLNKIIEQRNLFSFFGQFHFLDE
jgi:hypothetical protein